jgi:hypothetical protein
LAKGRARRRAVFEAIFSCSRLGSNLKPSSFLVVRSSGA